MEEADTLVQRRAKAAASPRRLVLLDLDLPDGDGWELARELIQCGSPFVIATSRPSDRLLVLKLGAEGFVAKPSAPRELMACIQNLSQRYPVFPLVWKRVLNTAWTRLEKRN